MTSRGLGAPPMRVPHDSGLRRTPARCKQVLREEGVRSLFLRILQEIGALRRLVLIEVPLEDPPPSSNSSSLLEARSLQETDLDAYVAFRPDVDVSEIRGRLAAGHRCFAAWYAGRLVSAVWVARQRAWIDYLAHEIGLAPDEAYAYDSFTVPDMRGMEIASARSGAMRRGLREAGVRRLLGAILPENQWAKRRARKRGHRRIGVIGYWKVGPWRRDFIRLKARTGPLAPQQPST